MGQVSIQVSVHDLFHSDVANNRLSVLNVCSGMLTIEQLDFIFCDRTTR